MRGFIEHYGFLIVLFPLLGAFINGFFGRHIQKKYGEKPAGYIACTGVFLSFVTAAIAFFAIAGSRNTAAIISHVYSWLNIGFLKADIAFLFDPLSAVMILIVTGVGFLIHVYSIGYMKGDPGHYRFFAYLNLFIFSMLILVLAENMLLLFIGWEGVGLCSYLLIGFWYSKKENAIAGNKAFIVNRVGDFGFLLGILILFWSLYDRIAANGRLAEFGNGTLSLLSFPFLAENIHLLKGVNFFGIPEYTGISVITVICLFLFLGATGKSAQIPLHVWLPDAMAGPTPVSALIHAATMVTAGIYMIGRLHFLFSMSSAALAIIAAVGALTALFAATIACTQNDIKRVLAYSTISQLGYMFMGMGVAAYSAGIFHLMTHAFFKAALFLGAGSVLIALHHENDIRWMGGLKRYMPRTFLTFLIATLTISGIPPFSGFFSKDEILWKAWSSDHGHPILWFMGFIAAGMTAFYMTRLLMMTFFGENRLDQRSRDAGGGHGDQPYNAHDIRESPASMTVPLIILAFFAIIAGFIGIPEALGGSNRFSHFLGSVFGSHVEVQHHDPLEYILMAASVGIAVLGIAAGVLFYRIKPGLPAKIVSRIKSTHDVVYNKYYIDEIYDFVFVSGTKVIIILLAVFDQYVIDGIVNLTGFLLRCKSRISGWFDLRFVDGAVNLIADTTLSTGSGMRRIQTGRIQAYIMFFFFVVLVFVSYKIIFP
jgi:NADH-quinone oxidoreductase subunit L